MITTTEILQTIPQLSQEDCFQIAEILLQTHVTQKSKKVSGTAIPSKTVVKP